MDSKMLGVRKMDVLGRQIQMQPVMAMLSCENDSSIKLKDCIDRSVKQRLSPIMQSKISSFFKHPAALPPPSKSPDRPPVSGDGEDDVLELWNKKQPVIVQTYRRKNPSSNREIKTGNEANGELSSTPISEATISGTTVNKKKRIYAQSHLELGQSDFLLRTCSTCGIKFAPGNEEDQKSHMAFHKDYTLGIQFKGWANERVIEMPSIDGGRIVSVISSDPPAHQTKVKDVVTMMESELGCGWIYHMLCKVYMFISSQRVAGCVVAEPIKEAFKVVSAAENKEPGAYNRQSAKVDHNKKESAPQSTALRFGNIVFRREVVRRVGGDTKKATAGDENLTGAIYCENEAARVVCGIRAIWVTPSNRRKRIASHLLDAARRSFCTGLVLEHSQIAFSQPTAAGKALATSYMGSAPLLLYKAETSNIS